MRPMAAVRSLMDDDALVSSASVLSTPSQGSPSKSIEPGSPIPESAPIPDSPLPTILNEQFASSPVSAATSQPETSSVADVQRIAMLQQELDLLRGKLSRKDKVVSELQRQITASDSAQVHAENALEECQKTLKASREEQSRLTQLLKRAESYNSQHEAKVLRMENEHGQRVAVLDERNQSQATRIAELEKANRALQNEKAVLQAAVDAREAKLTRMGELQNSFNALSAKVAQHDALRMELENANQRYEDIRKDLQKVEEVEKECRTELSNAKDSIERLTSKINEEQEKAVSCHSQLGVLQKQIQLLKGERNNYKQKNESLSKEVALVCRNGRTMKEVEKILSEHQSLRDEIESLRKQKRKAQEEAHEYKTLYDKAKTAEEFAGVEVETRQALERTAELEHLLGEMTEYVTAKDMQMDTLKQVNEQLQLEIHSLAKANFERNDI